MQPLGAQCLVARMDLLVRLLLSIQLLCVSASTDQEDVAAQGRVIMI
jgi:hypothetical protein